MGEEIFTAMMRMKSSNQLKQIFKGDLQGPIPNLELNSGLFQLMMCLVNEPFIAQIFYLSLHKANLKVQIQG